MFNIKAKEAVVVEAIMVTKATTPANNNFISLFSLTNC